MAKAQTGDERMLSEEELAEANDWAENAVLEPRKRKCLRGLISHIAALAKQLVTLTADNAVLLLTLQHEATCTCGPRPADLNDINEPPCGYCQAMAEKHPGRALLAERDALAEQLAWLLPAAETLTYYFKPPIVHTPREQREREGMRENIARIRQAALDQKGVLTVDIRLEDLPEATRRRMHADKRKEIAPSRKRREHQLQGRQAQAAGGDFEGAVLKLCELYKAKRIACLRRMPVPTAPAPKHDQRARGLRVLSGQAPFDLYGYYIDGCRYIGVELKSTAKPEPSLPIVAKGMNRGGLQEHQMDALASVAGCKGGTARVVWSRAGEIGVLCEPEILAAQERFHEGGYASKSIKWDVFQAVENWDWLGLTGKGKDKP